MLTRDQLTEAIGKVNIEALARMSGLSSKTLHRIKSEPDYSPTMETAGRISDALVRMAAGDKAPKASA